MGWVGDRFVLESSSFGVHWNRQGRLSSVAAFAEARGWRRYTRGLGTAGTRLIR